jgi:tetratricopeptide (TPR) repeat protein
VIVLILFLTSAASPRDTYLISYLTLTDRPVLSQTRGPFYFETVFARVYIFARHLRVNFLRYGRLSSINMHTLHRRLLIRGCAAALLVVCAVFFVLSNAPIVDPSHAYVSRLPDPHSLLPQSLRYAEPSLKGIRLFPDDPLRIDFLFDKGDEHTVSDAQMRVLIRYFLAAVTLPQEMLWVNLSPYEKDRVAEEAVVRTELGRDMLAQDYLLKQFSSSLTDPATALGRAYWKEVVRSDQGVQRKIWIVPDRSEVFETGNSAFLGRTSLKTLTSANESSIDVRATKMLLPAVDKEVNGGKRFAPMRQVYKAVLLGLWFKKRVASSFYASYIDAQKTGGIDASDARVREMIFKRYAEAFKKGAYDKVVALSDDKRSSGVRRRYFAGGVGLAQHDLDPASIGISMSPQRAAAMLSSPDAFSGEPLLVRGFLAAADKRASSTLGELSKKGDADAVSPQEALACGMGYASLLYAAETLSDARARDKAFAGIAAWFARVGDTEEAVRIAIRIGDAALRIDALRECASYTTRSRDVGVFIAHADEERAKLRGGENVTPFDVQKAAALAALYVQLNRPSDADKMFSDALMWIKQIEASVAPDRVVKLRDDMLRVVTVAMISAPRYAEAESLIGQITTESSREYVLTRLASFYVHNSEPKKALATVLRINAPYARTEALYALVNGAAATKDLQILKELTPLLREAVDGVTSMHMRPDALRMLAEVYAMAGQRLLAFENVKKIDDVRVSAQALRNMTAWYAREGRFADALRAARLIEVPDEKAQALCDIAVAASKDNQIVVATKMFPEIQSLIVMGREVSHRIEARSAWAVALWRMGRYEMAERVFSLLVKEADGIVQDPLRSLVFAILAEHNASVGRYHEAFALSRKVLAEVVRGKLILSLSKIVDQLRFPPGTLSTTQDVVRAADRQFGLGESFSQPLVAALLWQGFSAQEMAQESFWKPFAIGRDPMRAAYVIRLAWETSKEVLQHRLKTMANDPESYSFSWALRKAKKRLHINLYDVSSVRAANGLLFSLGVGADDVVLGYEDEISEAEAQKQFPRYAVEPYASNDQRFVSLEFHDRATSLRYGPSSYYVGYAPFKFGLPDRVDAQTVDAIRAQMRVGKRSVIVVGSPTDSDLDMFMSAYNRMTHDMKVDERPIIVLAPRQRREMADIKLLKVLSGQHIVVRNEKEEPFEDMSGLNVLVLNTAGELLTLYAAADVAVVGNDRNILEPASQGKPVLYMDGDWTNNGEARNALLAAGGAEVFSLERMTRLLRDHEDAVRMGARGLATVEDVKQVKIPQATVALCGAFWDVLAQSADTKGSSAIGRDVGGVDLTLIKARTHEKQISLSLPAGVDMAALEGFSYVIDRRVRSGTPSIDAFLTHTQ